MSWIKRFIKLFYTAVLMVVAAGCVESYQPPLSEVVSYLVVDGFVNASMSSATVKLSRTIGLSNGKPIPDESGATLFIESDGGDVFTLKEGTNGNYSSDQVTVKDGKKYRLRITTNDGKKYSSKFMALKSSSSLDNVTWKAQPEGVRVYVNAHDETNQTHYYKWTFTETWRYSAIYTSYFKMEGVEPVPRIGEYILDCWKTAQENQILIASTLGLASDVISDFPVTLLPAGTQKLSHSYSILVEQRALDEEEYNYWRLLEKTTENLGGLFDPLPAQVTGNIFNEDDPAEPVLGYFSTGKLDKKRMFIVIAELPDYLKFYTPLVKGCEIGFLPAQNIANTIGNNVILDKVPGGYSVSTAICADCRVQGGVNTKPDFWP